MVLVYTKITLKELENFLGVFFLLCLLHMLLELIHGFEALCINFFALLFWEDNLIQKIFFLTELQSILHLIEMGDICGVIIYFYSISGF